MSHATNAPAENSPGPRVRLRLFGALRDVAPGGELTVQVPRGATVATLRDRVKEALARTPGSRRHEHLVDLSALASETGILAESHAIADEDVCLSILPPVCGG